MATSIFRAPSPNIRAYYSNVEDIVYHYTSPDGLKGILSEDGNPSLFFTRYDCMNDASEGKHVIEVFRKTVENYSKNNPKSFDFCCRIKCISPIYYNYYPVEGKIAREIDDEKGVAFFVEPHESTPFICCFSRDEDSLPMWTYYSKNGGYEGYNVGVEHDGILKY